MTIASFYFFYVLFLYILNLLCRQFNFLSYWNGSSFLVIASIHPICPRSLLYISISIATTIHRPLAHCTRVSFGRNCNLTLPKRKENDDRSLTVYSILVSFELRRRTTIAPRKLIVVRFMLLLFFFIFRYYELKCKPI